MAIKDNRTNGFQPVQGKLIFAGYKVNEQNVKEMFQFMGVRPTKEIVEDAIGYMSSKGIEINMSGIHDYITERGLDKNRLDLRQKKSK